MLWDECRCGGGNAKGRAMLQSQQCFGMRNALGSAMLWDSSALGWGKSEAVGPAMGRSVLGQLALPTELGAKKGLQSCTGDNAAPLSDTAVGCQLGDSFPHRSMASLH